MINIPFLALLVSGCLGLLTPALRGADEARVAELLAALTAEEKILLLGGTGFTTQPIPRLGIPALRMSDGPLGVRGARATVLVGGVALAATWDPASAEAMGAVLGRETINLGAGAQAILGPCVNIHRNPRGGRNGESFGEDPWLAGRIAVGYIGGVQGTGVAACLKHFACNNQETGRKGFDVQVDERALREIYLPAFRTAVREARPWTLMSAYNRIEGVHCTQNRHLLDTILRGEWGYDGLVMSDWEAVHDTLGAALAGNDLEMPDGAFLNQRTLAPLLADGRVPMAAIDAKVRNLLRCLQRTGLLDGAAPTPDPGQVGSEAHRRAVREAGGKAVVLLKNQGLLPLDPGAVRSLAVIGAFADRLPATIAGSGQVVPIHAVSPLAGIRARFAGARVGHAPGSVLDGSGRWPVPAEHLAAPDGSRGLLARYYANTAWAGEPVLARIEPGIRQEWPALDRPGPGLGHEGFSVRWSGTLIPPATGSYEFALRSDDGSRLWLDEALVVDNGGWHGVQTVSGRVELVAGRPVALRVDYLQGGGAAEVALEWTRPGVDLAADRLAEAAALAGAAEVAVVCVGLGDGFEGEEHAVAERASLALPGNQAELIRAVAAANPRTVVVVFNGGQVDVAGWIGAVPAAFEAFYPGQEGGAVIAALLTGDINPSGRLPVTIARRAEDWYDHATFPAQAPYAEGVYVGYRWFDKRGIEPLFPFGHGLSYTTFAYGAPVVDGLTVTVPVRNAGTRAGEEVVQLYVRDPLPRCDRPVRELKRFARVHLAPGETRAVDFTLAPCDFAWCDVPAGCWRAPAGAYAVDIGASSRDLRASAPVTLAAEWREPISARPRR